MKAETTVKFLVGIAAVVFIAIMLVVFGNTANAQTATAGAVSGSQSGAIAGSSSFGLGVGGGGGRASSSSNASPTIVVGSGNIYEASDLKDSVPAVFVPALTTSNGTCANSFSIGGTGPGFGVAFGKTYVSGPCNARFSANQLNSLGQNALAMETMCGIKAVYDADQRMSEQYGSIPVCAQGAPEDGASIQPVEDGATIQPTSSNVIWFDDKEMDEINELAANDQMTYDMGMNLRPIAPEFNQRER